MIKTILAAVVAGAFLTSVPAFANDKPAGDKAEKKDKKKEEGKKDEKAGGGGW